MIGVFQPTALKEGEDFRGAARRTAETQPLSDSFLDHGILHPHIWWAPIAVTRHSTGMLCDEQRTFRIRM